MSPGSSYIIGRNLGSFKESSASICRVEVKRMGVEFVDTGDAFASYTLNIFWKCFQLRICLAI
jgi:hypothetical protein